MKCPHCGKEIQTYDILETVENEDGGRAVFCGTHERPATTTFVNGERHRWTVTIVAVAVAVIVTLLLVR